MASHQAHLERRRKHQRIAKRARQRGNNKLARTHLRAAQQELVLARRATARAKAAKRSSGPSGLSNRRRRHARKRAVQAAFLGFRNRGVVHYTQGGRRWEGINKKLLSKSGRFPRYADCSSFTTWCLWNALAVSYGVRDVVNSAGWRAGFTGTHLANGKRVTGKRLPGDLVIYGHGFPGSHVAIYVGGGKVVSHGSEAGPFFLPVHYRSDVMQTRRYI